MARYWSQQEKSRKRASPSYRATQRRNSRSGRKAINCEKTVRPWFMNHCPPPQNGILKPVAVQIAARHKSRQTADWQGLVRLRKVLYRTLLIADVEAATRRRAVQVAVAALCHNARKRRGRGCQDSGVSMEVGQHGIGLSMDVS